ncbi:orotidine 5'-phosphate decarboxylase [Candidatus Woesearchaeota archaeon]|nr:orotidine 5'-phosphate decarboxylase [Candidatus Woesearchaeota archaeon]
MQIIKAKRSIIPSCDVSDLKMLSKLVSETADVGGIGAYKIGFELCLKFGIGQVVDAIRKNSKLSVIYDHQKAATDIPDMGSRFAEAVKGVDAVILFPVMGPETEKAWIEACKKAKLGVIVGGDMTHKAYLENDGGYIKELAPLKIYEVAAELGVNDFVVPGNKPEKIMEYREFIEAKGVKEPVFYSPGLVAQGGTIEAGAKAAGERWHAIVGRAIYEAKDMKKAAEELCKGVL